MALQVPPDEHIEQLLKTSPRMVPASVSNMFRAFCEDAVGVEAGFICLVRIESDGAEPVERPKFAVKLVRPVGRSGDSDDALDVLGTKLAASQPDLMRDSGLAVLADRAVPVWTRKGVRVFPKSTPRRRTRV